MPSGPTKATMTLRHGTKRRIPHRHLDVNVLIARIAPGDIAVYPLVHALSFFDRVADQVIARVLLTAVM